MAGRVFETAIAIKAHLASGFAAATGKASDELKKLADRSAEIKKQSSAISAARGDAGVQAATRRLWAAAEAEAKLAAEIKATEQPTEKQLAQQAKLAKEVSRAEVAVRREIAAADKEAEALRKAGIDTANLTSEQKRLADALAATERKAALMTSLGKLGEKARGVGAAAKSIFGDALKIGGAAAVAGGGLLHLAVSAGKADDELGDAAERLGIGVGALSELRYAAKVSGADVEDLDGALAKMAINIGKVAAAKKRASGGGQSGLVGDTGELVRLTPGGEGGGGEDDGGAQAAAFTRIGLSIEKLRALKPDEQLAAIANGIAGLKSHSEQASATVAIFGKSATKLVPLLKQGEKGVAALRARAAELGITMSEEAAEAADRFDKALIEAEATADAAKRTFGREFLPLVTDGLKQFSAWAVENKGRIQEWGKSIAKWIGGTAVPAVRDFVPKLLEMARGAAEVAAKVADFVGGWKNLGIALVAVRFAPLVSSLGGLAIQLGKTTIDMIKFVAETWRAVAAKKALAAAGGGVGGVPGAPGGGGVGGKVAKGGLVVAAALAGWETGQAIGEAAGLDKEGSKVGNVIRDTLGITAWNKSQEMQRLQAGEKGWKGGTEKDFQDELARRRALREARLAAAGQASQAVGTATSPAAPGALPGKPGAAAAPVTLTVAPQITVQGAATREELDRKLDEAMAKSKADALAAYDAREAERKRTSYR